MEFGKLQDISQVDFSLPPDPPEQVHFLQKFLTTTSLPTIYIGATGYHMKQWVGNWYPVGCRERDFLKHYGAQFNTIEHNTTHYRVPDLATIERWKNDTPADFRFCPKLPQTISHSQHLGVNSSVLAEFCENIVALREKLGYCFMQLPPHFSIRHWKFFEIFLENFPKKIPLAVEFRNESFFDGSADALAFFEMLREHGKASVITDVAGRRDVCHSNLTADTAMIRFVGNGLHLTDYQRVEQWANRFSEWFEQGLRTVYFFTHEPDNLLAPDLAKFAGEIFSKKIPSVRLRFPKQLSAGVQGSLF